MISNPSSESSSAAAETGYLFSSSSSLSEKTLTSLPFLSFDAEEIEVV